MAKLRSARMSFITLALLNVILTVAASTCGSDEREVCVIGGGSAGTYAAIRLMQSGISVALIERQNHLGGQVDTYTDPLTKKTVDYGVKVFNNASVVTNYFNTLNVPLETFASYVPNQRTIYANLATASSISVADLPPSSNITDGLLRYKNLLQKYPYLNEGFQLPSPIPEELLMPWGDFLEKHNLGSISGVVYGLVGGPGNILAQPTLYVAKNYNEVQVRSVLTESALTTAHGNNQELYDSALSYLGDGANAFVGSRVLNVDRDDHGVTVRMQTPAGCKNIHASILVIAAPPKLCTLEPFLDLSHGERKLFHQFNHSYIYASVVSDSGIPSDASLANVNPDAPFGIPPEPGIFLTEPSGIPDTHVVLYGSPYNMSEQEVKNDITSTLYEWKKSVYQQISRPERPKIVAFSNHSPYFFTVPNDAIKKGFYTDLNNLQGQHNTFYAGAAWQTSDSTAIWNFTESQILPEILKRLR